MLWIVTDLSNSFWLENHETIVLGSKFTRPKCVLELLLVGWLQRSPVAVQKWDPVESPLIFIALLVLKEREVSDLIYWMIIRDYYDSNKQRACLGVGEYEVVYIQNKFTLANEKKWVSLCNCPRLFSPRTKNSSKFFFGFMPFLSSKQVLLI